MGTEELLIFRIQNEIRALKLKTKTPEEVSIRERLIRLSKTNPNMADDLETQFLNVLARRSNDKYLTEKKPLRKKW
jgi:hypothetical protein